MDAVIVYERSSLPEHQKVALRLADAFLADPSGFGTASRAQTLEHFTPEQVVELLFKLVTWTVNKGVTALGLDNAIDESRLTSFDYDAQGKLVLHLSA